MAEGDRPVVVTENQNVRGVVAQRPLDEFRHLLAVHPHAEATGQGVRQPDGQLAHLILAPQRQAPQQLDGLVGQAVTPVILPQRERSFVVIAPDTRDQGCIETAHNLIRVGPLVYKIPRTEDSVDLLSLEQLQSTLQGIELAMHI